MSDPASYTLSPYTRIVHMNIVFVRPYNNVYLCEYEDIMPLTLGHLLIAESFQFSEMRPYHFF